MNGRRNSTWALKSLNFFLLLMPLLSRFSSTILPPSHSSALFPSKSTTASFPALAGSVKTGFFSSAPTQARPDAAKAMDSTPTHRVMVHPLGNELWICSRCVLGMLKQERGCYKLSRNLTFVHQYCIDGPRA